VMRLPAFAIFVSEGQEIPMGYGYASRNARRSGCTAMIVPFNCFYGLWRIVSDAVFRGIGRKTRGLSDVTPVEMERVQRMIEYLELRKRELALLREVRQ